MKKIIIITSFFAVLIAFSLISCKSAAPASTAVPAQGLVGQPASGPQEPVSGQNQALLDELNAAAAKAEAARKKAGDFEGNTYFPSEWESAEGRYSEAGRLPADNAADIEKAIAAWNQTADSFDSVYNLAIPLYAQAREDEIMGIRNGLTTVGAKTSFPEYFTPADEIALQALGQYENGDYYTAKDTAAEALAMYQVLDTAYESWLLRWEINERDFILYDPDNYERGGEIISDAMDAYRAEKLPLAMESAEEARKRYDLVLTAGWTSYTEERAMLAESERQAALEIKTNISAKEYFNEADSIHKTALNLQNSENYSEAAKQFTSAEALYIIASMTASEKRRNAAAAIREANEKIEESDAAALEAELVIRGEAK